MYPPEIQSGMMQYTGHGGTPVKAHHSRPAASGNYPGVVVIMEAFGLNDHIKDIADRFAEQGYCAIAPDMYTREGTPDASKMDAVLATMFAVPDAQAMGDLDAAISYLKGQSDSNGKVGAIGFCSGGRYTAMLGCHSANLDAAVKSAGGFLVHDPTDTRPVQPMDMIPNLHCPLMGVFGEEDANPSPAHAEQLKAALDANGKSYELYMYRNAGHAFFADYRPSYRARAAQDMWHKVLLFYAKHLAA